MPINNVYATSATHFWLNTNSTPGSLLIGTVKSYGFEINGWKGWCIRQASLVKFICAYDTYKRNTSVNDTAYTEHGRHYVRNDTAYTEHGRHYVRNDTAHTEHGRHYVRNDTAHTEHGRNYVRNDTAHTEHGRHYETFLPREQIYMLFQATGGYRIKYKTNCMESSALAGSHLHEQTKNWGNYFIGF